MNKKIMIIVAIVVLIVLVVIGVTTLNNKSEYVKIDLTKADENIANIKSGTYDLTLAANSLSENLDLMEEYPTLIYDFDLDNYGINKDNILYTEGKIEFTMFATETTSFMMFKAVEGKEETLLKEVDKYYEGKEVLKSNIEGYTVYVDTKDNEQAIEILKTKGYSSIFNGLMAIDKETLNLVGLTSEDLVEYSINIPSFIVSSEGYVIVKPAEGKKDKVKTALDAYYASEEQKWSTYLPAQYDLIKNRKVTAIGDYLVYIVSTQNDKVLDAINNAKM